MKPRCPTCGKLKPKPQQRVVVHGVLVTCRKCVAARVKRENFNTALHY